MNTKDNVKLTSNNGNKLNNISEKNKISLVPNVITDNLPTFSIDINKESINSQNLSDGTGSILKQFFEFPEKYEFISEINKSFFEPNFFLLNFFKEIKNLKKTKKVSENLQSLTDLNFSIEDFLFLNLTEDLINIQNFLTSKIYFIYKLQVRSTITYKILISLIFSMKK